MDLKARWAKLYPHERLFAGYLVFLACLILVAGSPLSAWLARICVHIAGAVAILILFPAMGESGWKSVVRHWLPVVLLPMVYLELDTLNNLFAGGAFHDEAIVAIEQSIFKSQPATDLRKWIPFRPLSEYLHFAYFSYYFLFPALGLVLFASGRRNEYRYASTVTLAVFCVCYTIFIVYPVGGPWNHFVRPLPDEVGTLVPPLVHYVLISGESIGTAFPSSHVAAALAIWLVAWQTDRRMFRLLAFIVPALIVATMYGGFHYAIDVVIGVAVGAAIALAGPSIYRVLGGQIAVLRGRK